MIYKNISVQRIIAKVMDEFQIEEGTHRISDMIEWAGSALEKIGAFPYFETKITGRDGEPALAFLNYQSKLPVGLHRVLGVAYSPTDGGTLYPMRYSTGVLGNTNTTTSADLNTSTTTASIGDAVILAMQLYDEDYETALAHVNDEPATKALLNALLSNSTKSSVNNANNTYDLTYVIHDGWIKTNVDSGYLTIAYQAIPTDIDGYPLVPDDPGFIEAIYWYIAMKLLYPMWRDGRVRDAVYFDAKSSWQFYCKQAYGNAMMPSIDQLRSIKNSWLRLIPDINEGDNFFTSLGQEEMVYNHNN